MTAFATRFFAILLLTTPLMMASCSQSVDSINPAAEEQHLATREAASTLNMDDFEQGQLAPFWGQELHADGAGLIVSEQSRAGKKAMRFSWKPTQYDGTNKSCHAELATAAVAKEETERWYGFSMYLPSATMANDDQIANLVQWHATPDAGYAYTVPPVSIALIAGNKLNFGYCASNQPIAKFLQAPTSAKTIDMGVAKYDVWVDYVVHIKWDATGKTGLIEMWQDGKQIINERGVSVGYVGSRNFWKFGLYCWTGKSVHVERTAYYDEARIGGQSSGYDAVRPGRANGTAK